MSHSGEVSSRRDKNRKRRRLKVELEVVPESADRTPPVVGYFPSGYNPEEEPPGVRVFRNVRRSNRTELVVSPADANVEFVGTSYSGEAAVAQLCTYALGVLDKDTGTLKIVPIAANKIFRLESRLIKGPSLDVEPSEGVAEDGTVDGRKLADLTSLYGTKKNKSKDKVWRSLNQQRNDASAMENLDLKTPSADIDDKPPRVAKGPAPRNIPPHDVSAVVAEKAYLLDEIILRVEWNHLSDILEIIQSGADFKTTFWQESGYPSFVFNRMPRLREIKEEEQVEKITCMLSYITHLMKFWKLAKDPRKFQSVLHNSTAQKIPRIIHQKLMNMFVDPVSNTLSTERKELLLSHILVLTLFVDSFNTSVSDIAADLGMTYQSLKPYYLQLGCKFSQDARLQKMSMTLPVPLSFPDMKRRHRKRY